MAERRCEHCSLRCPPGARYCCYGCELVAGLVVTAEEEGTSLRAKAALCAFFAMNLMAVTMMLYAEDVYPNSAAGELGALREIFRWAAAVFATPIMMILAGPLARSVLERRSAAASVDGLVLLSTGAAYLASLIALVVGDGPIYFEVAAMTLLLFCVGRSIEAVAKAHAAARIAESTKPTRCNFERRDTEGRWQSVERYEIEAGDVVRVPAGEAIPVDGRVLVDQSVDRSSATGESKPVDLIAGAMAYAGDIALGRALELQVARGAHLSRMARLESSTRDALAEASGYERIADRCALVLVPAAVLVAAATFAYWLFQDGVDLAARTSLAVLLCACPCAFGIATPLALRAALARAAERGLHIRTATDVERLAACNAVAFDKTGTLTTKVLLPTSIGGSEPERALVLAAALERAVQHPLGARLRDVETEGMPLCQVETVAGAGVVAELEGRAVGIGNLRLVERLGADLVSPLSEQVGDERLYIVEDGRVIGHMATTEQLREGVSEAFEALRLRGFEVRILSGDRDEAVAEVSRRLGTSWESDLTPDEKLAALRRFDAKRGPVIMVGDGTNDAPALAAASIGAALSDGTDLARIVAPIVVPPQDPAALPWGIGLARSARSTVRWNLGWAFAYNAVCVGAAATGYLTPLLAAIAMALSSIGVAANSARLLRYPLGPAADMRGSERPVSALLPSVRPAEVRP